MNIIAIDCGASFIKGGLFENGKCVSNDVRKTPAVNIKNWQQPTQISQIVSIVKEMVLKLADERNDVVLCMSNEMHGFLLADESGNPYTDYISWQMEFGSLPMIDIFLTPLEMLSKDEYSECVCHTGMPLRKGLPSANLLYICHESPKLNARSKLNFYTLGDYILRVLSGREPICHVTNAAATGLFNIKNGKWDEKLIDVVSGSKVNFPTVGEDFLEFELQGLHITALPALGDQQAALLGAGLRNMNDISFNIGTGGQVSRIMDEIILSDNYQVRPYFDGKYIKTIAHLPSGRALNVFVGFVQEIAYKFNPSTPESEIWSWILGEANRAKHSSVQCDLSFFSNPISSRMTGTISNIGEKSFHVGDLFISVFRQMADNFLWAADKISSEKDGVDKIIFSGGVAGKIDIIRTRILEHYPCGIEYNIAKNETLHGLMCYADGKIG